ncbi:scarecrow-like protein 34 [Selaginella moellendorffii]|uniref:scarecrow-like protein 34 n=1 Tax=Selaginella moellendorffii TaxID=88036 RepID=UPI000D1C5B22|nr:scarecrow-like protein 34 [Selaginella moellendorffii]|eukprot:XP_024543121.1 scarecrow-like protein 34 [Selaginella moellendorffii]
MAKDCSASSRKFSWTAPAVAANNSTEVHELVREIRTLASPQLRPVEKAVRVWSSDVRCDAPGRDEDAEYLHPDESSQPPGHGALHQPDDPAKRVHIIDYGVLYGDQWPSLIKALSERAEGLPLFKITGINFPSRVNLEKTGWSTTCGMHLELHSIATVAWESAQPRYHPLDVARLRGRDHRQPRKLFFEKILSFKPVMLFQSVVHADISSPFFIHRFDRAWRSFLARLESFEETMKLGLIDQSQLDFMDMWSASPRAKPGTAWLEMVMSICENLTC